jgi:hypothetical protein
MDNLCYTLIAIAWGPLVYFINHFDKTGIMSEAQLSFWMLCAVIGIFFGFMGILRAIFVKNG